MSKFKTDDRVRRTKGTQCDMVIGDCDRVIGHNGVAVRLSNYSGWHDEDHLELVQKVDIINPKAVGSTMNQLNAPDVVNTPNHYMIIGNTEACDLIKVMLGQYVKDFPEATPYQIYCAGNAFKYRLRAGGKDNVEQEIAKALKYREMHNG